MEHTNFHKISLQVSACFLRLHVCDVIQFRDDHARMRINGPLASLARLRRRIVLISYATFVNIATHFFGDENFE